MTLCCIKVRDLCSIKSRTYVVLSSHELCFIKSRGYTMQCITSHGQQLLQVSFRDYLPLEWFTLQCDYMTQGNTYDHRFERILMGMIWYKINKNTYEPCKEN